jgi:hypothetical protein
VSLWLWLCAGLAVGVLNAASIAGTIGRMRPGGEKSPPPPFFLIASGFTLRLALAALVLIGGLRQSAAAGLLAFAGIWLARWLMVWWWLKAKVGD